MNGDCEGSYGCAFFPSGGDLGGGWFEGLGELVEEAVGCCCWGCWGGDVAVAVVREGEGEGGEEEHDGGEAGCLHFGVC